ncbi:MFS transporter [Microbacterium saccharophilum]|uniref:MFS transporter n=2 Tax=Microbacterium saccharophilum TaxID=1213358 RepID=A0A5C8HZD3_9MICO|nr:MFS transporter [Microbacterium saccharophilum]
MTLRPGRRAVGLMALTQFLLEVQFWFPLWLVFLLELGFDLTTAVIADGVFRLVSVVAEIPLGMLADRVGRKNCYLLISGLSAATFAGIAVIEDSWHLFAVWILWGLLWALNSGAATSYAFEISQTLGPRGGARGFGLIKGAAQLAALVSLISAGWFYELDPALPFWLTAVLAVVAGLLALGLPDIPHEVSRPTLRSVRHDIRGAVASPGTRAAIVVAVLFLFHAWSVRILFQPLALDLGLTPTETGWMYALVAAVAIAAAVAIGWAPPAHRPGVVGLGGGLTVAACAATWAMPAFGPVLWLPVLSLGWAAAWTTLELELAERTRPAVRATVLSIVSCAAGIGIAVARPALGIIADSAGSPAAFGLWALAGVVVVAAMAIPLLRMREHSAPARRHSSAKTAPRVLGT